MTETRTLTTPLGHEYTVPGPWRSLTAIMQSNQAFGRFFFDPDKGPALKEIYQGRYLLTADEDFFEQRVYHLNAVMDDGSIDQVGEVMGYPTVEAAEAALQSLASARPELEDVVVEPGQRSRPSDLSELDHGSEPEWPNEQELEQQREEVRLEQWRQEERERDIREMTEDRTSDLYYADGAREMRRDAGIDR
jgi:hypothetical protein